MKSILIIADPYSTLDHPRDTTLHLIKTFLKKNKAIFIWCTPDDVFAEDSQIYVNACGSIDASLQYQEIEKIFRITDFHSIHWRKDPPVDLSTYQVWNLLRFAPSEVGFFNSIDSLLLWHEKFSTLQYREWSIPMLISNNSTHWKKFLLENANTKMIAKPVGSAASQGIEILPHNIDDALKRLNKIKIEIGGPWLILQHFDESVFVTGETRVFCLAGKIEGALRKMPRIDYPIMSWPTDMAKWPHISLVQPDSVQMERARKIAADLKQSGVHFATIDFIGHRILEINITSPGLLQWMDENSNLNLAQKYWGNII